MENEDIGNTRLDIFMPKNILKIILCAIFAAIVIWSMIEGFAKSEVVGAVIDLRSEMVNGDIQIKSMGIVENNGSLKLIGELVNESKYTYVIAAMAMELKNEKNETVEKIEPYMRKIKPGDIWIINEKISAKEASKFEIVKFYGTRDMSKKNSK